MNRAASCLLAGLALIAPAVAIAQVQDEIVIPGDGNAGANGRIAVNAAAGNSNQQVNAAVATLGDISSGLERVHQRMAGSGSSDRSTRIVLEGNAFAESSGLVGINAAAGTQNQLANVAVLSIGRIGAISDELLEQSRAPTEPSGSTGGTGDRNDAIAVGKDAFRDSSGLVQVNLIGGERNSSANTFVLNVLAGGTP
ncbi:MAG: hypothetical protein WCY92_11855 [Novosphingobium sp.]